MSEGVPQTSINTIDIAESSSQLRTLSEVHNIPKIVKRNTTLLAANQAFLTAASQILVTFGAIAMLELTGNIVLAGLAMAIMWGGRVVIVYQSGRWMDRVGRLKILQIGIALTTLGGVFLALSVTTNSLPGFIAGLIATGIGWGATQQNRVAMADMYPSKRRGEGIGYLMTASIVGSIAVTPFVTLAPLAATAFSIDEHAVIWFLSLAFLPPAYIAIRLVKPDPREIALNIKKYYPDEERSEDRSNGAIDGVTSTGSYIRLFPIFTAFVVAALAQGNMTMMMSLTSLVLNQHHVYIALISLAITVHIMGMYGLSMPIGRISDRLGRKPILIFATAATAIGSLLTPITSEYLVVTIGIFLVGLGWSAATVASTALISDLTRPSDRGRILGANDLFLSMAALTFPLMGSAVVGSLGFQSLGILGLLLPIPAMVLASLIKERRPGVYSHIVLAGKSPPNQM